MSLHGDILDRLMKRFLWLPYALVCMALIGFAWFLASQPDWNNLTPPVILVLCLFSLAAVWFFRRSYLRDRESVTLKNDMSRSDSDMMRCFDALDIASTISKTTVKALRKPVSEFKNDRVVTYNYVCGLIKAFMTNPRSKDPKVVLFAPDPEEIRLIPRGWAGHSPDIRRYRPEIRERNAAGFTYMTGEANFEPDITAPGARWEPNPESEAVFYSLITVPVFCGKNVIGVLSLTGVEKASYIEEEDLPYLQSFANALSPLLYYETHFSGKGEDPYEPASGSDASAAGETARKL